MMHSKHHGTVERTVTITIPTRKGLVVCSYEFTLCPFYDPWMQVCAVVNARVRPYGQGEYWVKAHKRCPFRQKKEQT